MRSCVHGCRCHQVGTASRDDLMLWVCELHNALNQKLAKPIHPCSVHTQSVAPRVPVHARLCPFMAGATAEAAPPDRQDLRCLFAAGGGLEGRRASDQVLVSTF